MIGRENVANADGAISELVKNTYDADATNCSIYFLPRYSEIPEQLSPGEFLWLSETYPQFRDLFLEVVIEVEDQPDVDIAEIEAVPNPSSKTAFHLAPTATDVERRAVSMALADMHDLWIIDDGDGMSPSAIEDNWMVIGTNFKEVNVTSDIGRTRTGAKGIGRFALDRLGTQCDLFSIQRHKTQNDQSSYLSWQVDWNAFDGVGKNLDQVEAELSTDEESVVAALSTLTTLCQSREFANGALQSLQDKGTGTAIRIGLLRDNWSHDAVKRLYKFLGTLVPPSSQRALNIQLLDAREPKSFGEIQSEILGDYDYKVVANVSTDGAIEFQIFRNELDLTRIDPALFLRNDMKTEHFDELSFTKHPLIYSKSFNELWPGQASNFYEDLQEAGGFTFELLFFKRSNPDKDDLLRYPYRQFQPGPRKTWLEEYGGIKVYRDNFSVRPYGEIGSRSYDWLNLGQRVAINPVAASRKGWNVSPQNIAGTVEISRTTNVRLADQSNREGIIQNTAFDGLRRIILKVIEEFENDRSTIHFNLNELYKSQHSSEEAKSEGATTAKRVNRSPEKATTQDAVMLAKAYEAQQDEIRELKDEQTMLRSLATLGTVLVSFSHEMAQLQDTMGSRSASLADILSSYISPDDVAGVDAPFHPYNILDDWEQDDQKVRQWFSFALSTINADRRRRKWIDISSYLTGLKESWKGFLAPRSIEMTLRFSDQFSAEMLAFEIDLDSIFNNLILNSVEAFVSNLSSGDREILIDVNQLSPEQVSIRFEDNGPGLSPDIKDASSIFRFAITTKMDRSGNPTGTGLGLWILSAVVSTYGGTARVLKNSRLGGFAMEIILPTREGAANA